MTFARKALLEVKTEFIDQVRTLRKPAQPVPAVTWWRSDAEVIDRKGAAATIEKRVRDTAKAFLGEVKWANNPGRK